MIKCEEGEGVGGEVRWGKKIICGFAMKGEGTIRSTERTVVIESCTGTVLWNFR